MMQRSAELSASAARTLALRIRTTPLPSLGFRARGARLRSSGALAVIVALAAVIAIIVAGKLWLPKGLPNGIVLLGLELGALNALPAMGVVLVYRANRTLNFAQGEMGAFAASLVYLLVETLHWSWFIAVPVSLAAATTVGALVEIGVIRRFFYRPRLIMTVATIGVAQLLGGLRLGLPGFFPKLPPTSGLATYPSAIHYPAFIVAPAIYTWDDVLILALVPICTVLLALYLRGTWAGLGTRASAENMERSRLAGIPVRRLSTIVWAIAGLLSGLAAILKAPVAGFSLFSYSGSSLMIRALGPAAIGGFESLPLAFVAALGLGVVEQGFFWNFARGGPIETVLLVVMVIALLARSGSTREAFGVDVATLRAVAEVRRIPRAVARLPLVRISRALALAVLAVALLALPHILGEAHLALAGLIGVHLLVGLSIIILTGWAGQVSLGQWAVVGVGAFVAAHAAIDYNLDFFATLGLGALGGGVASLLLGIPAQRLPGSLYGVTTFGFAVAAQTFLFDLPHVRTLAHIPRPVFFGRVSAVSDSAFYYTVLVATVLGVLAVWNIKRFRLADLLIATRDNPRAAAAFGVNVAAVRRLAFFLSGALAGAAGVLYAFHQQVVGAERFPADLSLAVLAMVVIGGLGSIGGVVVGAVAVRSTQFLLPDWMGFFATGIGMLIILIAFPGGIGEALFRTQYRLLSWIGRRAGVLLPAPVVDADTRPPDEPRDTGPEQQMTPEQVVLT